MNISGFTKNLPIVGMAASDEGDGWDGASVEGQKKTGRETDGDPSDMKPVCLGRILMLVC